MKAKMPKTRTENAINYGGEKRLLESWDVAVSYKGEVRNPVNLRAYGPKSGFRSGMERVHASIWVQGQDAPRPASASGSGSAGGCGYDKVSAAAAGAIDAADITLWGDVYASLNGNPEDYKKRAHIHGVGESAVEDALRAITRALGYRGKVTIIRNA